MCGICGVVRAEPTRALEPGLIDTMCRSIVHRGPDDQGIYVQGNVGLGSRRLSIIDLSSNASQPMVSADGQVVMKDTPDCGAVHLLSIG